MMPQTVPKRPTKGVTAPVMASQGRLRSKRVSSSEAAICMARCTAMGFFNTPLELPVCRRYSSKPPAKTATNGLGLNCSATAATSRRRWALRNARKKRPLCTRARRSKLHLERIIAQEITLNSKRRSRTTLATGPVALTKSTISPPTTTVKSGKKCIFLYENNCPRIIDDGCLIVVALPDDVTRCINRFFPDASWHWETGLSCVFANRYILLDTLDVATSSFRIHESKTAALENLLAALRIGLDRHGAGGTLGTGRSSLAHRRSWHPREPQLGNQSRLHSEFHTRSAYLRNADSRSELRPRRSYSTQVPNSLSIGQQRWGAAGQRDGQLAGGGKVALLPG